MSDAEPEVESLDSYQPLPSSHQMANQLGLDTHQVQIMKASFFGSSVLDQEARSKPLPQPRPHMRASAGFDAPSLLFSSPLYQHPPPLSDSFRRRDRPKPAVPVSPQPSPRPKPLPAPGLVRTTLVMAGKNLDRLVPMSESISNNRTGFLADHGLTLGRSFRVGWGPKWTLAHSGAKISQSLTSSAAVDQPVFNASLTTAVEPNDSEGVKFQVLIEKVDASPWMKAEMIPPSGNVMVSRHALTCVTSLFCARLTMVRPR